MRGRIADETGAIGFLSWESFDHEVGSLLKIENAQVNVFRDTPEINIGSSSRIEIYHDSNFASAEDLVARSVSKIEDLRDGSRDVEIIVEIQKMIRRDFKEKMENQRVSGPEMLQTQPENVEHLCGNRHRLTLNRLLLLLGSKVPESEHGKVFQTSQLTTVRKLKFLPQPHGEMM